MTLSQSGGARVLLPPSTHVAVYVGVLVFARGPWEALLVIMIHKAVGGFYLASVFAPDHKGMPQTDDESDLDFLPMQVITSRNVRGPWWIGLLFGSLNYQVEHHLFPRMPRSRLRRSSVIVKAHCAEIGVPYHETSLLGTYGELLRFLHRVGAPLRSSTRAAAD